MKKRTLHIFLKVHIKFIRDLGTSVMWTYIKHITVPDYSKYYNSI